MRTNANRCEGKINTFCLKDILVAGFGMAGGTWDVLGDRDTEDTPLELLGDLWTPFS